MKPWYKSKTIWFNTVMAALTVVASSLDMFQSSLSPTTYAAISMFVGVANVALRTISTANLTMSKE